MVKPIHLCLLVGYTCSNKNLGMKTGGAEKQLKVLFPFYEESVEKLTLITKYTTLQTRKPTTKLFQAFNSGGFLSPLVRHLIRNKTRFLMQAYFIIYILVKIVCLNKKSRIDLLNIHIFDYAYLPVLLLCKVLGIPVFYKLAGSPKLISAISTKSRVEKFLFNLQSILAIKLRRFTFGLMDNIQALNQSIKKVLVKEYGVKPEKIIEIPNAINCDLYDGLYRPGQDTFGFVGRLAKVKNLPTLVKAFSRVTRHHPGTLLRLFGEGPEEQALREIVKQEDLEEKVIFHNFVESVADIYPKFDIFVLPSFSEGISNSLLEAMSVGMPIVASDIPGNRAVLGDEDAALFFNLKEEDSLFEKMNLLLADRPLAERIRKNSWVRVREIFDAKIVVTRLVNAFIRIVIRHRS